MWNGTTPISIPFDSMKYWLKTILKDIQEEWSRSSWMTRDQFCVGAPKEINRSRFFLYLVLLSIVSPAMCSQVWMLQTNVEGYSFNFRKLGYWIFGYQQATMWIWIWNLLLNRTSLPDLTVILLKSNFCYYLPRSGVPYLIQEKLFSGVVLYLLTSSLSRRTVFQSTEI